MQDLSQPERFQRNGTPLVFFEHATLSREFKKVLEEEDNWSVQLTFSVLGGGEITDKLRIGSMPKTKTTASKLVPLIITKPSFSEETYQKEFGFTSKQFWKANVFYGEGQLLSDKFNRACALLRSRFNPLDLSQKVILERAAEEVRLRKAEDKARIEAAALEMD